MRKSKGQTVDLLYTNNKEKNKQTKRKAKKNVVSNKKNKTIKSNVNKNRINPENEIVIDLTPKIEKRNKLEKNKKQNSKNNAKFQTRKPKKNKKNSTNKKTRKNYKFIKWILLVLVIAFAIALFMLSSVFNIKHITVVNNNKLSEEEIISLSKLTTGINMFKTTNKTIRKNLKENAYINNVKVKRSINGTVTLDIEERIPTYMLEFANAYVYINNQGYMLEISEEKLELPIIIGFSTSNEEIKVGNRLNIDDLNKLEDIIKIMETSKNSPIANKITKIDISNNKDYILWIDSEYKTIKTGDMNNINIKLKMAGQVINNEKEKSGEIYFQEDGKKAIFKEEVSR